MFIEQQALLLPVPELHIFAGVKLLVRVLEMTAYTPMCLHKILMAGLEYCFDSISANS